jgi:hypothetical protein
MIMYAVMVNGCFVRKSGSSAESVGGIELGIGNQAEKHGGFEKTSGSEFGVRIHMPPCIAVFLTDSVSPFRAGKTSGLDCCWLWHIDRKS